MYADLKGKVVLVTGASTGIGQEVAKKFAQQQAKVVVNYFSNEQKAQNLVKAIEEQGGEAIAVRADVTNRESVNELIEKTVAHFGRLDVLINNAGSMVSRVPFEQLTEDVWNNVYDINVKSIYYVTQAALPHLKESENATIVNVASVAGRNGGGPGAIHYASAKGAVITLTKGMAKEFIPYGIRVNGVNPGVIGTPFHEKFSPANVFEGFKNSIPVGREGTPAEVANIITFLATQEASYLYGEIIEINGAQLLD
jgi:NAD(P)-dependent dehydrogenase (short-subunit alcohol dehydrogenase family)